MKYWSLFGALKIKRKNPKNQEIKKVDIPGGVKDE
jgi:hypothetical protein